MTNMSPKQKAWRDRQRERMRAWRLSGPTSGVQESQDVLRARLEKDVQAFLENGGEIETVPTSWHLYWPVPRADLD